MALPQGHFIRLLWLLLAAVPVLSSSEWTGWGGNVHNNRWAHENRKVASCSIASLTEHCRIPYATGVSATPVVSGNTVFYPTWSGLFVALDYTTCETRWSINVTEAIVAQTGPLTPLQAQVTNPISRTSPQLDAANGILYFGTLSKALLVAVNSTTGTVLDALSINSHELAVMTGSPTFHNGVIFAGASSSEGAASSRVPGYPCCSFIGNLAAFRFDIATGKLRLMWDLPMLPANAGWAGVAVWGSQPSIDEERGQVFFGTGNLYSNPPEYDRCVGQPASCYPPEIYQESMIAADVATGKVNWIRRIDPGPDVDFGMAPTFVPRAVSGLARDIIVVGQKTGELYGLDAANGTMLWDVQTSPAGPAAGLSWGIAVDKTRAYFTAINSGRVTWQLQPGNVTISNSAYGAASLETGELLWGTQAPHSSIAFGPPTVAGDMVLVARTGIIGPGAPDPNYDNTKGGLVAMRRSTGEMLADVELDANFHGGIAVQDEYVMLGTGYSNFRGNGSQYVFKVS